MESSDYTQEIESIFSEEVSKRINSDNIRASELLDTFKIVCGRAVFIKSKAASKDVLDLPPDIDYKHATAQQFDKYIDKVLFKMLSNNTRQISNESRALAAVNQRTFEKIKDFSLKKDLKLDDLRLALLNHNMKLSEKAAQEKELFLTFLEEKDNWQMKENEMKTRCEELLTSTGPGSAIDKKTEIASQKNEWKIEVSKEIVKSLLTGVRNANFLEDEAVQHILCDGPLK